MKFPNVGERITMRRRIEKMWHAGDKIFDQMVESETLERDARADLHRADGLAEEAYTENDSQEFTRMMNVVYQAEIRLAAAQANLRKAEANWMAMAHEFSCYLDDAKRLCVV